jgi:hypothetical protein
MSEAKEAAALIMTNAINDAQEAEELALGRSEEEGTPVSAALTALIDDSYTLAAAAQKVMMSPDLDQYGPADAVNIIALEAMEMVRKETVLRFKTVASKRGLLH